MCEFQGMLVENEDFDLEDSDSEETSKMDDDD
jgi:hypothetical protein